MKRFTVAEYAHKNKISRMTVYRMIRARKLPIGTTAVLSCSGICIEVHELPEEVKRKIVKAIEENI